MADPTASAVEEIRKRVMREAEEAFAREVQRLNSRGFGRGTVIQNGIQWHGWGTNVWGSNESSAKRADVGSQWCGWRSAKGPSGTGRPSTPPPGIQTGVPVGDSTMPFTMAGSLTEALRTLELPKLLTPGCDGASLHFGDWMTVVFPIMRDVPGSAKEWWTQTVKTVEAYYSQWLTASPLEKLRLKPEAWVRLPFTRCHTTTH